MASLTACASWRRPTTPAGPSSLLRSHLMASTSSRPNVIIHICPRGPSPCAVGKRCWTHDVQQAYSQLRSGIRRPGSPPALPGGRGRRPCSRPPRRLHRGGPLEGPQRLGTLRRARGCLQRVDRRTANIFAPYRWTALGSLACGLPRISPRGDRFQSWRTVQAWIEASHRPHGRRSNDDLRFPCHRQGPDGR